ncbi:MAG: beta-lactamase family protein, partial [Anaerolineae bacterium]|nr:beta-lactamase family protein [Anaerolineae bacterium]
DDLQALLDQYVAPGDPAVVLLVSTTGDTWVGAAGLTDLDNETPVQPGDLFRIGSITKTFVATLTVQLAEEGKLALDDVIGERLPADIASSIAYSDEITIRQLLNMTSGVFSYTESDAFNDAVDADLSHPWTAEEVITYVYDEEPLFAPGAGWYYSNSNYILLELIINEATGMTLADAMKQYIFDPLGMGASYIEMPDHFAEGMVRGYTGEGGDFEDITEENDGVGLGDGGIVTTAADLAKFPPALFEGKLVSESTLAEMLQFEKDEDGAGYGLGVSELITDSGVRLLGHDGSTSGFIAEMWYSPDYETTIVALTNNFDSAIPSQLVSDVADILASK